MLQFSILSPFKTHCTAKRTVLAGDGRGPRGGEGLWAEGWRLAQAYTSCSQACHCHTAEAATVSTHELTLYRRSFGALLWASGQMQPFLACSSSLLARRFHQAVGNDLLAVNRAVRAAQAAEDLPLLLFTVPPPHRMILFSDASSIINASPTAQTGFLVFMATDSAGRGAHGPATPLVLLAWGSRRQLRVTQSSFSAETYAPLDGMRAALEVACVLANISDGTESTLAPVDASIHCHSLFNEMSPTSLVMPTEACRGGNPREMYVYGATSSLSWLPAIGQLGDDLIKPSSSASLRTVLSTGRFGLVPAGSPTKTHAADQAELQSAKHLSLSDLLLSDCGAEFGSTLFLGCLNETHRG